MHFRPTSFLGSPQSPAPAVFKLRPLPLPSVIGSAAYTHPLSILPFPFPLTSVCHLDASAPKRSCPHPDLNRRVWGSHSRFCCPPIPFPRQRMGSFTASEPFPVRAPAWECTLPFVASPFCPLVDGSWQKCVQRPVPGQEHSCPIGITFLPPHLSQAPRAYPLLLSSSPSQSPVPGPLLVLRCPFVCPSIPLPHDLFIPHPVCNMEKDPVKEIDL